MTDEQRYGLSTDSMRALAANFTPPGGRRLKIGIFVCPGFIPMDIIGAQSVFGIVGAEIHLIWKRIELVEGFPAYPTMPTTTFADCPDDLDAVVVGMIPPEMVADPDVIDFFLHQGKKAKNIIATCSGVLVVGAAGLLKGRRATSNANVVGYLADLGATPIPGSDVVIDGNLYTSGPATGSFDASLLLLAALCSEDVARYVELALEYDPRPPFKTGTPELAGSELAERGRQDMLPFNSAFHRASVAAYGRVTNG
ncbi:DJ-1/PfpI family protein [Ensifer sp. 4252]|uniref:DJ-1/PfpI family protein n=1 Tax=Ensifer sp. 4252 TaxID=3373915 RepID=UPI003D1F7EAE